MNKKMNWFPEILVDFNTGKIYKDKEINDLPEKIKREILCNSGCEIQKIFGVNLINLDNLEEKKNE